ncbi:MAG: hypothetical protein D3909_06810, partial [Candidatus Electrothrix sp. ATG1]|nr:hypothetical protein [Candidatus Electrothrix sp. ATG1]
MYNKKNRIRTFVSMISIITPTFLFLTAGASFADNTNPLPVQKDSQKDSQKILETEPQKIEAAEASSVQNDEPVSSTTKSYPEETAFITSTEGLTEKLSTVKGGGVLLDLEGRFRTPRTATIGADGKVH